MLGFPKLFWFEELAILIVDYSWANDLAFDGVGVTPLQGVRQGQTNKDP